MKSSRLAFVAVAAVLAVPALGETLPPTRPAELGGALQAPVPAAPTVVAKEVSAPRPAPSSVEDAVELLNGYFNGLQALRADFVQVGGDGRRASGKLSIQKPGRMRFAYDPPATLEIASDGRSVEVKDSKLGTRDVYAIGQTPLKFLVKDRIDLAKDAKVLGAASEKGLLSLRLEDRSTIGGTSKVTIDYDLAGNVLRGWRVVDPQGYLTTVTLRNVDA